MADYNAVAIMMVVEKNSKRTVVNEPITRKKVLYLGGFELPDKGPAAIRVVNNGRLLRRLGYNVTYVGVQRDNDGAQRATYDGFDYISIHYPESFKEWLYHLTSFTSFSILEECEPDIVILYNFPGIAILKWYKACKKRNIKVIGDVTEWYAATGNVITKSLRRIDINVRMRYAHKRLDGMIAISRFLYDYYSKQKRVLLPPLFEVRDACADIGLFDKIVLTFAGGGGINTDRIDYIIKAIQKCNYPRIEFNIIGLSRQQYEEMYNHHLGADIKGVVFHGRLDHKTTIEFLKKSHFQIFIRLINRVTTAGFPSKFAESFSMGVPVITNKTSNIEDFLHDGVNGYLLENGGIDDVIQLLSKLNEMTFEKYKSIKQNVLNDINFHVDTYAKEMEDFLNEL